MISRILVNLNDITCWICFDSAWGEVCTVTVRPILRLKHPSGNDLSLTEWHLEVLPHGAEDRAGHRVHRWGPDWKLLRSEPGEDAGGGQHSAGGSSFLSAQSATLIINIRYVMPKVVVFYKFLHISLKTLTSPTSFGFYPYLNHASFILISRWGAISKDFMNYVKVMLLLNL